MLAIVGNGLLFGIIVSGPVPLALGLTRRYCRSPQGAIARPFLSVLTLWCLIQVSLGLFLGSIHHFSLRPVLALSTTLAVAGLVLLGRTPITRSPKSRLSLDSGEVLVLAILGLVAVILCDRIATQPLNIYDSLWFHGPIIARWYQTASFSQLDPLGHWIISHPDAQGYPHNWSVLSVFCLLPWQQDIFIALPMLLAWVLLGLATYLLARWGGATRFYGLVAAALVLSVPFVLSHVSTLHIDLPVAAIYAVSMFYLASYHSSRRGWDGGLCLASAGLLAGIKTPGLIYGAIIVALLVLTTLFSGTRDRPKPPTQITLLWIGGMVGGVLGGFWYISNSLTGPLPDATALLTTPAMLPADPVAPTTSVSPGIWQRAWALQGTTLTAQFNALNPSHWTRFGSHALARFQLPLVFLLLPVSFWPYSWRQCPGHQYRYRYLALTLVMLITLMLYWNTPYTGQELGPQMGINMRYGFPVLGPLGAVAAISATHLALPRRWLLPLVLVSSFLGVTNAAIFNAIRIQALRGERVIKPGVLVSELHQHPFQAITQGWEAITSLDLMIIMVYLSLFILLGGLYLIHQRQPQYYSSLRKHLSGGLGPFTTALTVGLSTLLLLAVTVYWLQSRAVNREYVYRDVDQAIAEIVPPGERVAYFMAPPSYILYGKHLDREVINLSPDSLPPTVWLDTLQKAQVRAVVTLRTPDELREFTQQSLTPMPTLLIFERVSQRWLRLYRVEE